MAWVIPSLFEKTFGKRSNSLDMLNNLSNYEINSPSDINHTRLQASRDGHPFSMGWNGTSTDIGQAPLLSGDIPFSEGWNGTSTNIGSLSYETPDTTVAKVTVPSTTTKKSAPSTTNKSKSFVDQSLASVANTGSSSGSGNKSFKTTNALSILNDLLPLLAMGGLGYMVGRR